jgi:ATP adenylyltransferase/5',5'''-P-1,P-4-tetraphosphate phosphorylase II
MKRKNTNKKGDIPFDALANPDSSLVAAKDLFSDYTVVLNKFPVVPSHVRPRSARA